MRQKFNERVVYIDLLRVLATFAVIFIHVTAVEVISFSLSRNWYIATIGDSFVRWSVPAFVMISGALFLNPCKEVTYKNLLTKYIPRLFFAYVFWTVVYYLLNKPSEFRMLNLVQSPFHLWFLPMLMGVYFLVPMIRKIAQDDKVILYSLGVWIAYVIISFFQPVSFFKVLRHFYPLFNMNIVFGFSGYFLLGYFLSHHSFSKRQRMLVYFIGFVGAIITISGTFYMSMKSGVFNEVFFSNLSFQEAAMATAVFVLVKELTPKFGKVVTKSVDFVRKDLFGIYLTHALWLPVVNTEAFRHCCSEIITLPIITIIVFLLSLFTTKLIRLIPGLRKVVE